MEDSPVKEHRSDRSSLVGKLVEHSIQTWRNALAKDSATHCLSYGGAERKLYMGFHDMVKCGAMRNAIAGS